MAQLSTPFPPLMNLSHSIVAGGTFNQHIDQRQYIDSKERPGYARLLENVATAALHDSVHVVDPPKCHPNTRVAIIQNIINWALGMVQELSSKPILWLKGGAGAGKSAIARSVAERCSSEGLLLGTFFFGAADPSRNHVEKLVATISSQISVVLPEFQNTVATFIEDDPLIFSRSIRTQFSTLVIRPLSVVLANRPAALTAPQLIIIDGLDECNGIDSQCDLLFTLQEATNTTNLIRFLVCSRPESHLNGAFSLPRMDSILHKIFLDNDYVAADDIRVYLEDKFKQIKEGHVFRHTLQDPWPTPEMVDTLVNKSSGQFIYAATVVRYVESPRHRPDQRLNAIFKLRPPFKDLPFRELDALYRLIISKAEDVPTVLDIVVFPALYGNVPLQDIEAILQLEQGSVEVILADLHSIVTIDTSAPTSVKLLHKSLADFLDESQRAEDLYRDLSKASLSHVAQVISFFSKAHRGQQMGHVSCSSFILRPIEKTMSQLNERDTNTKADYVSSDILQASQQFPMFEFFRSFFPCSDTDRWNQIPTSAFDRDFIELYLRFLYSIKDVCESTRLVYWDQIRQYCKCVLAVLGNNRSHNWNAHFVFAYCHLLNDPHSRLLSQKRLYVDLHDNFSDSDIGVFGDTILRVIGLKSYSDWNVWGHFADITKMFHHDDLLEEIKEKGVFAKSACFCLASLCGKWDIKNGMARHNQRKKRERPWRWRQTVRRPASLGNRLALIGFQERWHMDNGIKLVKMEKAADHVELKSYNDIYTLFALNDKFLWKSEPVKKYWPRWMKDEQPQQWPQYIFLLRLIRHILPLAGRYEPLVTMCRKKCLSSLSQLWPKKSRRVRQRIDSYLRRMDAQGELECE